MIDIADGRLRRYLREEQIVKRIQKIKRPTIRDVSKVAGVSLGTASRVINRSGPVSDKAVLAVNAAIKKLDYNPNSVAQSLRRKRTNVVGCLIPDIANPVFSILTKALEKKFKEHGYILLIASSDMNLATELQILDLFRQRKVDGVIVSLSDENAPELKHALDQIEVPIVALDRVLPVDADAVLYDHSTAMSATVNYLFQLGHERIALITGTDQITPTRERIAGYKNAYSDAGLAVDPKLIRAIGITAEHGFEQASALLSLRNPPTAIVAGANQILVGVLRAINRAQLRIPRDISVVSCDDTPVAELMTPAITVVRRDIPEWGHLSADMLMARIMQDDDTPDDEITPARTLRMSCELLVRGSCATPPLKQ